MKPIFLIAFLIISRATFADNLPVFSMQPTNQTVFPGDTAAFNVSATGATSYQWLFNGADIAGATSATLYISNAQSTNCGYYLAVAKNATGWVPSQLAYLSLDYTYGGSSPDGAGVLPLSNTNTIGGPIFAWPEGSPANGTVQIVAGPELDQMQPVGNEVHYRSSPAWNRFYNGYYNAPNQTMPTTAPGQMVYYSVLVKYTNNDGFGFRAFTQPSTILKLIAGTNNSPLGFSSVPLCFGLKFPEWFAGEGLEPALEWISPVNQSRVLGEIINFTNQYFAYTDYGIPTTQWRKNGIPLLGATNTFNLVGGSTGGIWQSVFALTNLQTSDTGIYDLIVYGNEWVVSSKITLSVQTTNGQGVFQKPQFLGNNFVCDLTGAAGRNYKIQQSTDLLNWRDLITLSNSTGTVTFTNSLASVGTQFYRTVLLP